MRCCHRLERFFGQEIAEPGIAQAAGSFFYGFGGFASIWTRLCRGFGCGIDAVGVEGQVERGGEGADEFEIGIGFGSAEAVVEMGDVEDEAQFPALLMER